MGAAAEIIDRGIGIIRPRRDEGGGLGMGKTAHHAQAEPYRKAVFLVCRFQRAIEAGVIDADRPDIDAMIARITDDLGWGVKAHRLRIEERGAEDIGMVAFEPGRGISD